MTRFFIALIISLTFCFQALAKEYKLEELLEIAEQNSSIKAAEFLALSQKRFANQQKYWENPTLSFDRAYNQNTYSINQAIPFAGKLQSKYNIEDSEYKILETRKNNLALFIKAETFVLLYQYYALQKKIELAQKRLNRLSLVDQYLSHIVLSSPTQLAQSQITKDKIKLIDRDLTRYRNDLYQTWNRANIYLNLESEPKINLTWIEEKNYPSKSLFINAAIENNLSLKEQKFLINKSKSELSFAKIEKMPDVNISADRSTVSSASVGRDSSGVGLSLSVPLINRNQEKILGAESKIKSQEFEFEFQKNQLINNISNDINELETALKIAKNFPVADIDKTLLRLSKANSEFKKGILDFITYIELDSQEYQTIDTIIDTQVDVAISYASLMTKIGTFILPKNAQQ
ncbi:MAG: TolC family protein [Proteobacteria bacterium]|nr:TolC family protein [Pseudomonadota bacterium]